MFFPSRQPSKPKSLDAAFKNTLVKLVVAVNTGGHLNERGVSDGGIVSSVVGDSQISLI